MKFKIISIIILLFFTSFAHAQLFFRVKKLNPDSLAALINNKEGIELVEVLNLLSNVICRKDIDSSINLAKRAIELSEKLEYQKGLADGYFNVGNGYFLFDSIQPSIINYLKAQRIYEDIEPTEEYANLLMQLGVVNYFTGKLEVSKPFNRKANRIYESINDSVGMYSANFGMGVFYHVYRPLYLDSVIYYCLKAKSFLDTANDQNKIAYLYTEIGGACQAKFSETKDTSYLYKALEWNYKGQAQPGMNDDAKLHLYKRAMDIYDQFNTDKGLDSMKAVFNRVMNIYDSQAYFIDNKISELVWLGSIKYREKDYESAINLWKQFIELTDTRLSDFSVNDYDEPINGYNKKLSLRQLKMWVYAHLAEIYEERKDYEKVLEYSMLWMNVGDELIWERNQNLIIWMGSASENEKARNRIALLARDNELHKIKVKQFRIWLIAMGAFLLILVLVTILFIRNRKIQSEHKIFVREQKLLHDLELKKVESDKLKELDQLKSQFFANVSHEFRTPLTLILSPAEKLLSKVTDENLRNELLIIHRYARRLRRLINQLLNLSKLEAGKLKLNAKKENIVKLLRGFTQSFESLAKQRQIKLFFNTQREELIGFVDRNKLEIIINNLLSNAFKFTPEEGRIEIAVSHWPLAVGENDTKLIANSKKPTASNGQWAEIKISDTGSGIPPEHIDQIFERFYLVEDPNNFQHEGTGIGLALAKELIELHQGEIRVESKVNEGATFTVILPLYVSDQTSEDIEQTESYDILEDLTGEPIDTTFQYQKLEKKFEIKETEDELSKPVLLIVEDNPDLRAHICYHLSENYNILEARDGEEGITEAIANIPDLIISDVMMPKMDGYELSKKLKTDERTSHIPVILLTARASKESRIEGLETGADDFITKPFDMDELLIRVKNLIEQRKHLSEVLEKKVQKSHGFQLIDFEDSGITSMDEQFLEKIFAVLKKHHTDPEFSVETFCKLIGLSRIQLHRKIKALARLTTSEFIRTYRLNRAAQMLKEQSGTIAEIAYDVGFSSPSYFTECFRKQFGKPPTEFNGNK